MKGRKGLLVVFEGLDGSGKTTLVAAVHEELTKVRGLKSIVTYEPRYPEFKKLLESLEYSERSAYVEALIFAADRMKHVNEVIEPHLAKGYLVLVDRYYYSSLAYQGARGVPLSWIREINKHAPKPDLAFYLDVEPEEGLKRRAGLEGWKRFERLELLRRAREIYLKLVDEGELILLDTSLGLRSMVRSVLSRIIEALKL